MKRLAVLLIALFTLSLPLVAVAELGHNPPKPALSTPMITQVSLSSRAHVAGTSVQLQVSLVTANVPNGTTAGIRLVRDDSAFTPVNGVETSITLMNDSAIAVLGLPADLTSGVYRVVVSVVSLGLSDAASRYSVRQAAEPAIVEVLVAPPVAEVGQASELTVSVSTFSVSPGSTVVVVLTSADGMAIDDVIAQGVITDDAVVMTLATPGTLLPGVYYVRVAVGALSDSSTTFTVLAEGQQNTAPAASNVLIEGTARVGEILAGHYDYSDVEGDLEGDSQFRWLVSDTAMGEKVVVGYSRYYTLTAAEEGKYVSFEVTPVASSGDLVGGTVLSSPVGPVLPALTGEPVEPLIEINGGVYEPHGDSGINLVAYYLPAELTETISAILAEGYDTITLLIGLNDTIDPGAPVKVSISETLIKQLDEAGQVAIVAKTRYATISIPYQAIETLAASGRSGHFTVTPGSAGDVPAGLPKPMRVAVAPLTIAGNIPTPLQVQMQLDLPLPVAEKDRDRYVGKLRIFAVGSDGSQEIYVPAGFDIAASSGLAALRSVDFMAEYMGSYTLIELPARSLVTVIGKQGYVFDDNLVDMPACYYSGNEVMMPVRMLEAFGVGFEWHSASGTAILSYAGKNVRLTIGSIMSYINGSPTTIVGASGRNIAPELAAGRTMVPLRFVSEKLGFDVHWDYTHTVMISLP